MPRTPLLLQQKPSLLPQFQPKSNLTLQRNKRQPMRSQLENNPMLPQKI
jgi:hypothetical protein